MTTREEILRVLAICASSDIPWYHVCSDDCWHRQAAALHARLSAEPAEPHPDTVLLDKLERLGSFGVERWQGADDPAFTCIDTPDEEYLGSTLREAIAAIPEVEA
jgi:hypothetical protein